jgi:hypothetical protein
VGYWTWTTATSVPASVTCSAVEELLTTTSLTKCVSTKRVCQFCANAGEATRTRHTTIAGMNGERKLRLSDRILLTPSRSFSFAAMTDSVLKDVASPWEVASRPMPHTRAFQSQVFCK